MYPETKRNAQNYKVKMFMGIGLPKELFISSSTLELGEPIGQGTSGPQNVIASL
jgi:hypothetical protein